ncbi:NfeD family protein [Paenibacillus abyssi]
MKYWLTRVPLMLMLAVMMAAALVVPLTAAAASESTSSPAANGPAVYVIPVEQTIESGLQAFLERSYKEAEEAQAERVILVINTLGGRVDSADEIGNLIRSSSVPTVAYVQNNAISAGAYIALNAKQIVMNPAGSIGSAAVVDAAGTLIDNPKTISYWSQKMSTAAEMNGRDGSIAIAMVNPDAVVEIESLNVTKEKGEILTLSAQDALKAGYAEHLADSVDETLMWLGLDQRTVIELKPSPAEQIARWVTSPVIMTLLLIIGIAGVAIELIVPGFGLPGILGIVSFGLYFFGHYIAGFAGMESVVLFVVGIALLVIELFVPSFGILGILGITSLVSGVVMAAYDTSDALTSLLIAFVIAAVIVIIFTVIFKKRGVWNKFILSDRLTNEEGYVPAASKEMLLGKLGITLTPLRPSGTIEIGDERVDVVTSGEFVGNGKQVKVIKVEGTRVVVREVE